MWADKGQPPPWLRLKNDEWKDLCRMAEKRNRNGGRIGKGWTVERDKKGREGREGEERGEV